MNDLELLSQLRPQVDDPDPVVLAKHRIAVLERADPALDPGPERAPRRWRLAIGGALAAGIAAAVLVSTVPGPGTPVASAATVLDNAAAALATAPSGHGDWAYTSTVGDLDGLGTTHIQVWEKRDGTDTLSRVESGGWTTEVPGRPIGYRDLYLDKSTYDYLASLPIDTAKLRDEIYAQMRRRFDEWKATPGSQINLDQAVFGAIEWLAGTAAPPALKAALYRVAATIPGIEYVDDAVDAAGRHGIGVAYTVNTLGDREVLIFDRDSYRVLGAQGVFFDGHKWSKALLEAGLVEGKGQTP